MNQFLEFLKKLFLTTALELWIIFGMFFLLGLILYFLSRSTRKVFTNSGNQKIDIFFTGWIGTPIHELGHALFCLLFGHKIKEIKLFKPDKTDGTIGYVTHSFDPKNIYHIIGNFFIGCGPMIFGTIMLFILMYFLIPNSSEIVQTLKQSTANTLDFPHFFASTWYYIKVGYDLIRQICTMQNLHTWKFWLFLYLSLAISSHMQLSPPDIKTMVRGLLVIIGILFLINIIVVVWEFDLNSFIVSHFKVGFAYILLILAICISLINYLISYFLMSIFYILKYKKILKPF